MAIEKIVGPRGLEGNRQSFAGNRAVNDAGGAQIFGEELSDMWEPVKGDKGKWTNRLLSQQEAKQVMAGVHQVSEVDLYKAKDGETEFKG